MKLIVTEKNDAAQQIARLLSESGKPTTDKVYNTPVYRFRAGGEEHVAIGLRGHILKVDFPVQLVFDEEEGWRGLTAEGELIPADLPDGLARPPYKSRRKPYLADGIDIKGWKIASLPYLVWAPIEKQPAEKEIIRALKNLAKKADSVVIATDFDREGELIGSDALRQVRDVAPTVPVSRARYSAFTKAEIDHAFSNLVELDQNLADAGESRQYIDLIWGAVLTRYLTTARFSGLGNVRSAGRVQTPTLALVVERERERLAFQPVPYWVIQGMGAKRDGSEPFRLTHATARFWDEAQAQAAFAQVAAASEGRVTSVERKRRTQQPPAPFNTTSLQAAAAAEGISPARTMRLAESLYMDGLISYPRVDNTVYPDSLDLRECVRTLRRVPQYAATCDAILAQGRLTPTRGKQETTDHPPIYPTAAASPDRLDGAAWKLYNLIARRFLATLMGPATTEATKVTVDVGGEPMSVSGSVLVSPGFRGIYPYGLKKDEQLPPLAEGEVVGFSDAELVAKQTEPPARYSQGKLIQEMEKRGLGTKSTRASIIDTLYERKYFKNDPVEPSQLGMAVIDALSTYAPRITSASMTAELEDDMTRVAEGAATQDQVVSRSRALLAGIMDVLVEHTDDVSDAIADAATADARIGACPRCGRDLVVKTSAKTRGSFAGCMGWPDCDVTYPLPQGKVQALEGEAAVCPACGAPRVRVQPFRSKAYETCVNPACPTNAEPDLDVGTCPTCAAEGREGRLVAHKSERSGKRFIRCTNYELCNTSYPLPARGALAATGEACPDCGAPLVQVTTSRGPWRLCPNMDCPGRAAREAAKASRTGSGSGSRSGGRSGSKAGGASGSRTGSGSKSGGATSGTAKRSPGSKSGGSRKASSKRKSS